ncbi:2-oxo acid dehydrogenase subunit E2 [Microbacterium sp. T2.11-28]|uniref:2-oxo acid dehydrogenase subunit E2 n=1 Tax=Microbacterium sp. T2.11-28 TaxID=3041169 RepID=UPI002477C1AA|nr:2-oxo acid dehydrogenase subunit E2 [Microbacterium sp. T2.11-28]CAI9387287.1 Dihydrolipoyllysine-residue acetyltransferase component of pyruvate dehydrogenase complex [Microbacterium sp. T2.11-28]
MAAVVRMPALAAGATEAAVQAWLVAVGDRVEVGQEIVEIETEKAVVEYEAEEAGIVAAVLVDAGAAAAVGSPILVLAGEGQSAEDALAEAGVAAAGPEPKTTEPKTTEPNATEPATTAAGAGDQPATESSEDGLLAPAPAPVPPEAPATPEAAPAAAVETPAEHGSRQFASPLVRKLARERGLDLTGLKGSGPHGRIVRRDLDDLPASAPAPATAPAATTAAPVPATGEPAPYTDVPHTGMRRAIARRLTESTVTVPHFFLSADCIVDEVLELRTRINEKAESKISVNDFVLKAVAAAMLDVPEANAIWTDEATRRFSSVDIGVAVSIPGGLVTPVVRGVEALSLSGVNRTVRDVAERARAGRLKQHELEGGSFAVSNLGMYGTSRFSAIINPPHAGILAVGAAERRPVVGSDGELTAATVMTVTLSADHRVLDGALAAQWLAAFTDRIQNPLTLLV